MYTHNPRTASANVRSEPLDSYCKYKPIIYGLPLQTCNLSY